MQVHIYSHMPSIRFLVCFFCCCCCCLFFFFQAWIEISNAVIVSAVQALITQSWFCTDRFLFLFLFIWSAVLAGTLFLQLLLRLGLVTGRCLSTGQHCCKHPAWGSIVSLATLDSHAGYMSLSVEPDWV